MKSSLKPATKAEKRRFEIIKRDVGCIACYIEHGVMGTEADAHHLLSGGRRISHSHTIPLCPACHTGPNSIHKRKQWFRDLYGTDDELLDRTDALVKQFESNTVGAL